MDKTLPGERPLSTRKSSHTLKWDTLLRYRLIEIIALWEGRLTTNVLQNAFGIGRQKASADIKTYRDKHPSNLSYDASRKGYYTSPEFIPHYTQGVADEYLQLITQHEDLSSCFADTIKGVPHTTVLYPPIRSISPDILRPIVQACRDNNRIECAYVSLNHPDNDGRIIAPHTIVWNGYRWHVRAWCEKSQGFRDFVLSRISEAPESLGRADKEMADDLAWNTSIEMHFCADPRLSAAQQKVVEMDFGMHDKKLVIETRAALATYLMQLLRIKTNTESKPEAQQVVLKNVDELREWIF